MPSTAPTYSAQRKAYQQKNSQAGTSCLPNILSKLAGMQQQKHFVELGHENCLLPICHMLGKLATTLGVWSALVFSISSFFVRKQFTVLLQLLGSTANRQKTSPF